MGDSYVGANGAADPGSCVQGSEEWMKNEYFKLNL
jgi:hypothetical protein